MNSVQKRIWNPFFTHAKPSNIAALAWIAFLFSFFMGWLEVESTFAFAFFFGLAVGLSFMQIGFNWGQYQSLWIRFFLQNRDTIFEHGYNSERRSLIFLVALVASKMLRVIFAFILLFTQLALLDFLFPRSWGFGFLILELLVVTAISGFAAQAFSRRVSAWGDAKLNELSDYSYVFDADQEGSTQEQS